jgi:hypothetical protein
LNAPDSQGKNDDGMKKFLAFLEKYMPGAITAGSLFSVAMTQENGDSRDRRAQHPSKFQVIAITTINGTHMITRLGGGAD